MNAPDTVVAPVDWPEIGPSRVPYPVYTDPALYREELERFFYRGHWCYVGLEAEIPEAGDFKRSRVGERSVIMVRGADGAINVVENRCAHRGAEFCQQDHGTGEGLHLPVPPVELRPRRQPAGRAVPPRRTARRQGRRRHAARLQARGAEPREAEGRDASTASSSPRSTTTCRRSPSTSGPRSCRGFGRVFNGRKLHVLGYYAPAHPGQLEADAGEHQGPYHPGLLHTWFVVFGLWRADQKSQLVMDAKSRHAVMISRKNEGGKGEVTQGVSSFKENMKLNDLRVLDVVPEHWWNGPTVTMLTLFPSVIVQQQVNSVSTRHIVPRGPGAFDFVLDALRLRGRHAGDDAAAPAAGEPVRARRLRLGRRRRGDRDAAARVRSPRRLHDDQRARRARHRRHPTTW